jgi:hypothetical protein
MVVDEIRPQFVKNPRRFEGMNNLRYIPPSAVAWSLAVRRIEPSPTVRFASPDERDVVMSFHQTLNEPKAHGFNSTVARWGYLVPRRRDDRDVHRMRHHRTAPARSRIIEFML